MDYKLLSVGHRTGRRTAWKSAFASLWPLPASLWRKPIRPAKDRPRVMFWLQLVPLPQSR
jgi:hypothetical protein